MKSNKLHPIEEKLLRVIWGQNYNKHVKRTKQVCSEDDITVNGMSLEKYLSEQIDYRFN